MRIINKRGNTIEKIWIDDKKISYVLVGTVGDFLEAKILTYCDYPAETWVLFPGPGCTCRTVRFGATRESVLENIPK